MTTKQKLTKASLEVRDKALAEAEDLVKEQLEESARYMKDLAEREEYLDEKEVGLRRIAQELEQRTIQVDEQMNLIAEKTDTPLSKIRALKVTARVKGGFCRGGMRFSESAPSIVALNTLSMAQLQAIRDEPNLKVEEILA